MTQAAENPPRKLVGAEDQASATGPAGSGMDPTQTSSSVLFNHAVHTE